MNNEEIMQEGLEAIVAVERDSPAALGAVLMIAQETLESLTREHLPHPRDEPCGVCTPTVPARQQTE